MLPTIPPTPRDDAGGFSSKPYQRPLAKVNGGSASSLSQASSITSLGGGALSARGAREAPQVLLPHEDTVRNVYKKHAQIFFEEMKESFLKEAALLRKSTQKALTRIEGQESMASLATTASQNAVSGLASKVEKQQAELHNLGRYIQSEFSTAKKAVLTPMWKERTLQEIAQGELRGVCAEEVMKALKEIPAAMDDEKAEAAVKRLLASGGFPLADSLKQELQDYQAKSQKQIDELAQRADESIEARKILVECCNAIEDRQRSNTERLEAELASFKKELHQQQENSAHKHSLFEANHYGLQEKMEKELAKLPGEAKKDTFAALQALEESIAAMATRLQEQEATFKDTVASMMKRLEATPNAEEIAAAIAAAAEGKRSGDDALTEARRALADANSASATATRARVEAEAARGLATGAVETVARGEAHAAQFAVKLSSLEARTEEVESQIRSRKSEAAAQQQKLEDIVASLRTRLEAAEANISIAAAEAAAQAAEAAAGLEAHKGLAKGSVADGVDSAKAQGEDGSSSDAIFAAAKLRAHLEIVEARIKEIHQHTETVGDEALTKARRLATTVEEHTSRFEALEGRLEEVHRHHAGLSSDLAAQSRRLIDHSAQHGSRVDTMEERLRGSQLHWEGGLSDASMQLRSLSDSVNQHSSNLAALDRQAKLIMDQAERSSRSIEELRKDFWQARSQLSNLSVATTSNATAAASAAADAALSREAFRREEELRAKIDRLSADVAHLQTKEAQSPPPAIFTATDSRGSRGTSKEGNSPKRLSVKDAKVGRMQASPPASFSLHPSSPAPNKEDEVMQGIKARAAQCLLEGPGPVEVERLRLEVASSFEQAFSSGNLVKILDEVQKMDPVETLAVPPTPAAASAASAASSSSEEPQIAEVKNRALDALMAASPEPNVNLAPELPQQQQQQQQQQQHQPTSAAAAAAAAASSEEEEEEKEASLSPAPPSPSLGEQRQVLSQSLHKNALEAAEHVDVELAKTDDQAPHGNPATLASRASGSMLDAEALGDHLSPFSRGTNSDSDVAISAMDLVSKLALDSVHATVPSPAEADRDPVPQSQAAKPSTSVDVDISRHDDLAQASAAASRPQGLSTRASGSFAGSELLDEEGQPRAKSVSPCSGASNSDSDIAMDLVSKLKLMSDDERLGLSF